LRPGFLVDQIEVVDPHHATQTSSSDTGEKTGVRISSNGMETFFNFLFCNQQIEKILLFFSPAKATIGHREKEKARGAS